MVISVLEAEDAGAIEDWRPGSSLQNHQYQWESEGWKVCTETLKSLWWAATQSRDQYSKTTLKTKAPPKREQSLLSIWFSPGYKPIGGCQLHLGWFFLSQFFGLHNSHLQTHIELRFTNLFQGSSASQVNISHIISDSVVGEEKHPKRMIK